MPRIVFFAFHGTTGWWKHLASRIEFADAVVVSDLREDGAYSLVSDFYRFMGHSDASAAALTRFGVEGCDDIILRCRVLRSIDRSLALRMIGGMTQAIERALDEISPELIVSFTIDRYVMDVMERVARQRGVEFLEMTASIIPDHVMFLRRGRPVQLREPSREEVDLAVAQLCTGDFTPVYVRDARRFSIGKFWRVFGYFAVRGAFFNAWRFIKRDRYNCHYLDALKRLKHKVRLRDVTALMFLDTEWDKRLNDIPRARRVFLGLQLFPEASMDYWLRSRDMLAHDDVVARYCEVLGAAGYSIFIKDHPLQFGFRQRDLFERLSKLPSVTLVPYEVPANLMIEECAVSITFTGTVGFQAALAGVCSVASDPYYATEKQFLNIQEVAEIDSLPERLAQWQPPSDAETTRREIVRHLVAISLAGNYFSWRKFDPDSEGARASVAPLARMLNEYLPRFLKSYKHAA